MYLIKKLKENKAADPKKVDAQKKLEDMEKEVEEGIRSSIGKGRSLKEGAIVDGIYYLADYIDKNSSKLLLSAIEDQPEDKWVTLHHAKRRLQKWGKIKIKQAVT